MNLRDAIRLVLTVIERVRTSVYVIEISAKELAAIAMLERAVKGDVPGDERLTKKDCVC